VHQPDTAYEFLMSLPRYDKRGAASLKPGFERIERILALVGNPHRACPIVHVAGTNGKGSTTSMVAAICTAAGLRTGLQTSPHLFDVTERMRVDGVPADPRWLARTVHALRIPIKRIGPSFFEATTALSFLYFAEQDVDLAVVEVGLGGRLDATNVVSPIACGISSIGLDHVAILGNTLSAIAAEKAGIIKHGIPVFTTNSDPEVVDVLRSTAAARDAPFYTMDDVFTEIRREDAGTNTVSVKTRRHDYGKLQIDLKGEHQIENASLAISLAEAVFEAIPEAVSDNPASLIEAVRRGLAGTRNLSGLRGRLDIIRDKPMVIADVGHNASGVQTALRFARDQCKGTLHVAVGLLRDKDYESIAGMIAREADFVHVVPLDGARAIDPAMLEEALRRASASLEESGTAPDILDAFVRRANPDDVLLLVGSHQVVEQLGPGRMV
jgi:dihydrofolate synthase/folylpolyglutamate synthase